MEVIESAGAAGGQPPQSQQATALPPLLTPPTEATSARAGRYEAQVKDEFRMNRWTLVSAGADQAAPEVTDATVDLESGRAEGAEAVGIGGPQKNGKKRGQNKKRPRDMVAKEEQFCRSLMQTGLCKYGDDCKFMHDFKDYLKRKEKDLGPECPVYKLFGQCPSGVACRWGSSHITPEGLNLRRPEAEGGVLDIPQELNNLSMDVVATLQRSKYPFKTPRFQKPQKHKGAKQGGKGDGASGDGEMDNSNDVAAADGAPDTESPPVDPVTAAASQGITTRVAMCNGTFDSSPLPERERRKVDFRNKVYVAPLTTVGNLPFRRVMKLLGADITCGEMALAHCIVKGQRSELALLRRHPCEDVFGVQLAGAHEDVMGRTAEIIRNECQVDFIDLNLGCPIDLVNNQGMGAALMNRVNKIRGITQTMTKALDGTIPLTIKMRMGWNDKCPTAHTVVPQIQKWVAGGGNVAAVMVHGRSRQQRYTKTADWEYIARLGQNLDPSLPRIPIIGNGDILSWTDYEKQRPAFDEGWLEPCAMLGRGALIKPWLPTEIKEQRHWDISATERLDILQNFVNYGLEHWGSDQRGVNNTRRFLLEWLSFLFRYVPVGVLEHVPIKINERPMPYRGRNELECLLASPFDKDWVKISEMLLGPVPEGFAFQPKHKANAWG